MMHLTGVLLLPKRLYLCDHAGPASDNPWASFDEGPETATPGMGALSPLYETGAQPAAVTGESCLL